MKASSSTPFQSELYEKCSRCKFLSVSITTNKCPMCGFLPRKNMILMHENLARKKYYEKYGKFRDFHRVSRL